MSRLGHLTDQRRRFVEEYVITGNATKSALAAGYKDTPSLSNQACKLRRELFKEINDEVQFTLRDSAPKALQTLTHLLEHSSSDSVRLACAKMYQGKTSHQITNCSLKSLSCGVALRKNLRMERSDG